MVDVVPALLLLFGLVALLKPDWVAVVDRRQKAAGTARRPTDIEMSDGYYTVVRMAGLGFVLFGLLLLVPRL